MTASTRSGTTWTAPRSRAAAASTSRCARAGAASSLRRAAIGGSPTPAVLAWRPSAEAQGALELRQAALRRTEVFPVVLHRQRHDTQRLFPVVHLGDLHLRRLRAGRPLVREEVVLEPLDDPARTLRQLARVLVGEVP